MKKSVAITTIIAFHAVLIGGMLIQAGCSSEPEAQPQKAQSTVEEINPSQKDESTVATEQPVAETPAEQAKEVIPPEGSPALRAAPTRPAWNMSGSKSEELVPAEQPKKSGGDTLAPMTPAKPAGGATYIVQKGDSLAKIAKKHNVSLEKLLKLNGMNRATIIKVGQEIALPEPTPEAEVVPAKPAAPQIESAVETDELTVYIVKKGDSLGRIARKHKTTVKHLMDINGLKNHNIKIGQKLNVSKKGAAAAKQSETKKAVVLAGGELEYVVKSGDTLGGIAHRHGTSVKAIMERNSIKDARKLRVGQKLVIVSKKAVAKAEKKQEAKPEQPKAETKSEPQITVVGDANAKTESAASQAPVVAPAAAPAAPATPAPAVAPEAAPATQQTELPVTEL